MDSPSFLESVSMRPPALETLHLVVVIEEPYYTVRMIIIIAVFHGELTSFHRHFRFGFTRFV